MLTGIDIGGTKCAVVIGDAEGVQKKIRFETTTCAETLDRIFAAVERLGVGECIGISCGGPLDSKRGIIQSPPNLPGWDNVPIVKMLEERFGVPAYLCNDANACALAEWKYGAGKGSENMVFLTFGTGLGAGIIVNGRLLNGTCGAAGEVGHLRLAENGPVGFGKRGSFEGFCSGGGLAQIGRTLALEKLQNGEKTAFCASHADLNSITAKSLAEAAMAGDETAIEVYRISGEYLGKGLSLLVDILNPEVIVIGSVFARSEALLRPAMESLMQKECLAPSLEACRVVPAALGESIGDLAALAVAMEGENL
ncbi:MAG: ROK family protein [Clostridia bacterium]|nr:ROK family protein [Clostridia bacterium]